MKFSPWFVSCVSLALRMLFSVNVWRKSHITDLTKKKKFCKRNSQMYHHDQYLVRNFFFFSKGNKLCFSNINANRWLFYEKFSIINKKCNIIRRSYTNVYTYIIMFQNMFSEEHSGTGFSKCKTLFIREFCNRHKM